MALDERGRLWVSQSSEYPIAAGPGEGNDRITIQEYTDEDGRVDKVNDFANDLNIPIGIMPVKGGAIGYSIPNIYKFTNSNHDGKADKREVMFGEFGHEDTHCMINNLKIVQQKIRLRIKNIQDLVILLLWGFITLEELLEIYRNMV